MSLAKSIKRSVSLVHKGESQYTLTTQSESYPEFPGKSRKLSRDQVDIFQEAEETTQNWQGETACTTKNL